MRERIQAIFDYWRQQRELAKLDERELGDLGLSRDQLHLLANAPATLPDRVAAMARVFGLTEAEIKREYGTYLELLTACATCGATRHCHEALAHAETLHPADCGFCPNKPVYDAMSQPAPV